MLCDCLAAFFACSVQRGTGLWRAAGAPFRGSACHRLPPLHCWELADRAGREERPLGPARAPGDSISGPTRTTHSTGGAAPQSALPGAGISGPFFVTEGKQGESKVVLCPVGLGLQGDRPGSEAQIQADCQCQQSGVLTSLRDCPGPAGHPSCSQRPICSPLIPESGPPQHPEGTCEHRSQVCPPRPTALQGSPLPGAQAQVLPETPRPGTTCPIPSPLSPPSTSPFYPHGPPACGSNTPGLVLPQGLCTDCALGPACCFPGFLPRPPLTPFRSLLHGTRHLLS